MLLAPAQRSPRAEMRGTNQPAIYCASVTGRFSVPGRGSGRRLYFRKQRRTAALRSSCAINAEPVKTVGEVTSVRIVPDQVLIPDSLMTVTPWPSFGASWRVRFKSIDGSARIALLMPTTLRLTLSRAPVLRHY